MGNGAHCIGTFCHKLWKNGWTDRFTVWVVLGWAEGSTSSIVLDRRRQCALMERYIGATWRYDWTVNLLRWCVLMSNYF